jgi:hypothetical protein
VRDTRACCVDNDVGARSLVTKTVVECLDCIGHSHICSRVNIVVIWLALLGKIGLVRPLPSRREAHHNSCAARTVCVSGSVSMKNASVTHSAWQCLSLAATGITKEQSDAEAWSYNLVADLGRS